LFYSLYGNRLKEASQPGPPWDRSLLPLARCFHLLFCQQIHDAGDRRAERRQVYGVSPLPTW